jgi:HK97 family phage prohead protease
MSDRQTPPREVFPGDVAVVEERAEGGSPSLRGYAAVFNQLSQDLGGFREQIAPGAFADALSGDIRLLVNHAGLPFARTTTGTLKLSEDKRGLAMDATLDPVDPDVLSLLPKIRSGNLSQMSFAFTVKPNGENWAMNDDGVAIRTLTNVRLFEVSVVTFPAFLGTDVAVRSMQEHFASLAPPGPTPIPLLTRALSDQTRLLSFRRARAPG